MKSYLIEENIKDWIKSNGDQLFIDILEACEDGLNSKADEILVASIKTMYGVTLFKLPDMDSIVESLRKCENNFVGLEDYEKAARARDCGNSWNDRKIYKENSLYNV